MTRRQQMLDVALIGAVAVGCTLEVWAPRVFGSTNEVGPRGAVFAAYVLATGALVTRRRFPLGSAVIVATVLALEWLVFGASAGFGVVALPVVAGYAVGAFTRPRLALSGLVALLAAGVVWDLRDPQQATLHDHLTAGVWLLPTLIAWLVGRMQGAEQRERMLRLEHEREERAQTAVAEERARIARELHDVVGHEVSVMTVQASGVRRLLRSEQEREREALLAVERTGRQALVEMRRFVGVLRRPSESATPAPQPGLGQLEKLVEQARAAGLPVELRVEGEPAPLPPGLELAAYRIVQEGLTNTLKHAHARQAQVFVYHRPDELELVVADDGEGDTAAEDRAGHGLVGMRERVAVYGGELRVGPVQGGGYRLCARLPLGAA